MACTTCPQSAARGGLPLNTPNMSYLVFLSYFGSAEYAPFMGGRYLFQGQNPVEVEVSHAAQMLGYRSDSTPLLAGDALRNGHLFQLATLDDFSRMQTDGFLPAEASADEYVAPGAPAAREVAREVAAAPADETVVTDEAPAAPAAPAKRSRSKQA
jgi:hypothetical protein